MGEYKRILTNIAEDKRVITEKKIDIVDMILIIFTTIFALVSIYFVNENDILLKQVDEISGKYNEVNYQADLINNAYEDLKKEYERLIDYIRISDKYDLPEGTEDQE